MLHVFFNKIWYQGENLWKLQHHADRSRLLDHLQRRRRICAPLEGVVLLLAQQLLCTLHSHLDQHLRHAQCVELHLLLRDLQGTERLHLHASISQIQPQVVVGTLDTLMHRLVVQQRQLRDELHLDMFRQRQLRDQRHLDMLRQRQLRDELHLVMLRLHQVRNQRHLAVLAQLHKVRLLALLRLLLGLRQVHRAQKLLACKGMQAQDQLHLQWSLIRKGVATKLHAV